MGNTTITFTYNLSVPVVTVRSTSADFTPQFQVTVGPYAKPGDFVEAQFKLTGTDWVDDLLGTQVASLDEAGIITGLLDWDGEPSLVDGDYSYRFRSRREGSPTAWSSDVTLTVAAGYGVDRDPPILSNPTASATGDNTATVTIQTNEANGKLYVVAGFNNTALTSDQIIAGIAVDDFGAVKAVPTGASQFLDITTTGTKSFDLTNLVAGEDYFFSFVHVDLAGNVSDIVMSARVVQPDTAIPIVSGVTMSALTSTTASGQFTTSQPLGNYYWVVCTGSAPSVAQVKAGQNGSGSSVGAGMKGGPTAVTNAGTYAISATGLTANTSGYKLYVVHTDELSQDSAVGASSAFATPVAVDVTAPTLTSPTDAYTSSTTAALAVVTDEPNGTLYVVVTTSSTKPSAAQIRAGQNHLGAAAAYASSQAISSTGNKTFNATGLTQSTAYYAHFTHRDNANNDATVVSGDGFTTPATPSGGALGSSIPYFALATPTDNTQPDFVFTLNDIAAGDVLTLSWTGYASGSDPYTVTAGNLDPADPTFAKFSWQLSSFVMDQTYTFQLTQTRGAASVVSSGISITFGGESGGVIIDPPPPDPGVETFFYLTESGDILGMEDGVSRYLREGAP